MTISLYPTGHSAVRLCNVTGDALRYDAFVTHALPKVCLRMIENGINVFLKLERCKLALL